MLTAIIDSERCDRSPGCPVRRVCPRGAVVPISDGANPGSAGYVVDASRCTGCGICVRVCPAGAVQMASLTPASVGRGLEEESR